MGLWDKLKGELVDIVEWLDDTKDTMVYRFERYDNEIKYGAKLVVREGQVAVFINQGQLADVFYPGTYTLQTENLPILSTLKGWKHGLQQSFQGRSVFLQHPAVHGNENGALPDPAPCGTPSSAWFGVTAFGIYSMRVQDPATFMREVVGTDGRFTTDEIQNNLRGKIGVLIKEAMPELGIPVIGPGR